MAIYIITKRNGQNIWLLCDIKGKLQVLAETEEGKFLMKAMYGSEAKFVGPIEGENLLNLAEILLRDNELQKLLR